jgi:hypothetical protein
LKERIVFPDYYQRSDAQPGNSPIEIYDPVNPNNNVARQYSESDRQLILEAAEDAVDAISFARRATTKADAVTH